MIQNDTSLVAVILAALSACSCNLDTQGERRAPPPPAQVAVAAPELAPVKPAVNARVALQAAQLESTGETPSAEVMAKISALHQRLDNVLGHPEGSRIAFVDCQDSGCSARVSASDLGQLRNMLRGINEDQEGRVGFVVRERLDPYLGRSYEADLTLDTDAARAVPEDDAELLERPAD